MERSRIRVAVIDSGVNPSHPHIARVDGGYPENDFLDRLGHGTAVMAAIQEKAPGAEYFAARVFGRELHSNIDALIEAIAWAITEGMDVINLSLGTANAAHAGRFAPFLKRAIFVSAAGMFPGDLPGVIRVAADATLPREEYRLDDETFVASPYPRPIEGVPPERNLNGASFAVANMTGFVARACEHMQRLSYHAVFQALQSKR
ncbi:MAG TPA: S8 family serine peptidase [Bryobacteraceae bacterium]|nr:S8 family serine peptidase [Bryobacteraceae bacterium]